MTPSVTPLSLEDQKARGRKAKAVLEDPLYLESWKAVADGLTSQRRRCPVKDTDMAVRLVLCEQMLHASRAYLEQVMVSGQLAEIQLAEREEAVRKRGLLQRIGLVR